MRILGLIASAIAVALFADVGTSGAVAGEFTIFGIREDRTKAFTRSGGRAMPPYGETLHGEVLREIRRNHLPFQLVTPVRVMVLFAVNRRGELVHVSLARKSRAKLINDYAEAMVRQASRRFPPPPAEYPGDFVTFTIPINLQ